MAILVNRLTTLDEPAQVVSPIDQQDIDCFLSEWKPVLDAKIAELKQAGLYTRQGVADHNVEDAHWEWPAKLHKRAGILQWASYAVRCGGRTQGLMFLDMLPKCRHASQANKHMVYVDLVSTAPWNRPVLAQQPLYRGVGFVLITEAILHSQAEGFDGRIGLHSLPRAEKFYRDQLGMEPLGPDSQHHDLHYFEMTSANADAFLRP